VLDESRHHHRHRHKLRHSHSTPLAAAAAAAVMADSLAHRTLGHPSDCCQSLPKSAAAHSGHRHQNGSQARERQERQQQGTSDAVEQQQQRGGQQGGAVVIQVATSSQQGSQPGEGRAVGSSARPAMAAAGAVVSMLALAAYGTVQLHRWHGSEGRPSAWLVHANLAAGSSGAGKAPSSTGGLGSGAGFWPLAGLHTGCEGGGDGEELPWWCDTTSIQLFAGTALGYVSTVMYLSSRVSQIAKNKARKSAEGLSLIMFLMTVTANVCTGCSIILRLGSVEALKQQLPWLAGAFGTVGLDITIAYQASTYQRAAAAAAVAGNSLTAPLLLLEG
jgi:hypothetical protein